MQPPRNPHLNLHINATFNQRGTSVSLIFKAGSFWLA